MQLHPDYTTKDSPWTVADTVQRLTAWITGHGQTIFATIDQSEAARGVGLELRDTVLIVFGSPKAGTPVMEAQPLAALDLPLKLLVWDDHGRTLVSYLKPAVLASRYGLSESLAAPLAGIEVLVDSVLIGDTGGPAGDNTSGAAA
jgi:uncharacterized protein (DUF302 family)